MTTLAQGRGRGRAARRVPARSGRTAAGGGDFAASDLHEGGEARLGCEACESLRSGRTDRARREEKPGSKVASAPRAPVPARACTGRAAGVRLPPRASQHRAVGRLNTALAPAEATCRGESACRGGGRACATRCRVISPRRFPPPRLPRASTLSAAGAPRLQKSCCWRRPQSERWS